ncbi:hypothetical protein TL16_g01352 [Triparma laevis f. inornata]|uniref:DNA-directed RNA polymerase subunit beta n=1 Tax=Triparma laevis f. inornata TaxID=1714386 RepID=A0A9W6ZKJ5_9STRA|nr:hypothetical protein TL16_g01352 [Triparma laevis f. inornata]
MSAPSHSHNGVSSPSTLANFRKLLAPHVQGYDYFATDGVTKAFNDVEKGDVQIQTREMSQKPDPNNKPPTVKFWYSNPKLTPPSTRRANKTVPFLPKHARELGEMYDANFTADFHFQINDGKTQTLKRNLGKMPVMVGSVLCHTHNKTPTQLVAMGEEDKEFGGCFIVNGIERCVRLLQVPRRNVFQAIKRPTYKSRGSSYSEYGVAIRSAKHTEDCSSVSNTLHYLNSGGCTIRFAVRKQEFLVPAVVLLRALRESTDMEIWERIVRGDEENTFLTDRVGLLLHDAKQFGLHTAEECKAYIGARFRSVLARSDIHNDVDVGQEVLDRFVMIHCAKNAEKAECILLALRKLYSFVQGDCAADNADSMQNQELLLPGHLICTFVKEKVEETIASIVMGVRKEIRMDYGKVLAEYETPKFWTRICDRYGGGSGGNIGKKVAHFLSTGNIISSTGLDLMQVSGYTIVAERLNFLRYISHYRSVHRGQFFTTMKTTTVRKLLPDSWGFLCPVHTPDGGPCGLLNHLATKCETQTAPMPTSKVKKIPSLLVELGVTPSSPITPNASYDVLPHNYLTVCLDGKVVGGASIVDCKRVASTLRLMKVNENIDSSGPYPGLYIFTGPCRFIRPVLHRESGKIEKIGPMEQPNMEIACLPDDIRPETTHQELDPTNMLSLIASMTPFSDYNQSPRNMYQCQMGKQTMGTPAHALPHRTDNKMYKIQNPQAPMVQTQRHGEYRMDDYPNGTNAVVAVLSYTGFDMEDAMILNKSAYERGFGHASVYKTKIIDLKDEAERMGGKESRLKFSNKKLPNPEAEAAKERRRRRNEDYEEEEESDLIDPSLGDDGLPSIGQWVSEGDALYSYVDELTGKEKVGKHKEMEKACVQHVRLLGSEGKFTTGGKEKSAGLERLSVTLRIPRNPVIGDKFSSRHGQKGVMSILWPQIDMPFSESGMSPDVIINPHAFPSRMTIGMLIESMAGKSGALHGRFQDATPFQFHETGNKLAVDHFGEQLQTAGYNYYGSEALYSGVTGQVMHADLYIGVVYYQRLRHMVSDKSQVRATGAVNQLTRQPIKGRKKGGGIRLGEMERDALLSHGTAYLLHDRLMMCSDRHVSHCCGRCGGVLTPQTRRNEILSAGTSAADMKLTMMCNDPGCKDKVEQVEPVSMPYVFKYLSYELAGMGIKMKCELSQ